MRLALLTHEPFFPPSGGGSAEAVYLVRELVGRGHEVHLFCPKVEDAAKTESLFSIRLHEFTTWRMGRYASFRNAKYLLYPFFLERMVVSQARLTPFDLILSQHAVSAVAAGRLKTRWNTTVVMNFLDHLTGFLETWPAYLAPRPILKRLKWFELSLPVKCGADAVLTVSDVLADLFVDAGYPREKILPIYYGYDADLFPFVERAPVGTGPATLVMHGSFDRHHLGPIAEEGIAEVIRSRPNTRIRFIGRRTEALEALLKKLVKRIPSRQIETTGFVAYPEVAAHLRDASLGLVPYEESTGTHCAFVAKIVEYLAVGLPVVSTPLRSARRYFAAEPRIRFSEFNGRSFATEVLTALNQPTDDQSAQSAQAKAASERVRAELDWRSISRKAVDFIEKVHRTGRAATTAGEGSPG